MHILYLPSIITLYFSMPCCCLTPWTVHVLHMPALLLKTLLPSYRCSVSTLLATKFCFYMFYASHSITFFPSSAELVDTTAGLALKKLVLTAIDDLTLSSIFHLTKFTTALAPTNLWFLFASHLKAPPFSLQFLKLCIH
jgi:hypothetical protein